MVLVDESAALDSHFPQSRKWIQILSNNKILHIATLQIKLKLISTIARNVSGLTSYWEQLADRFRAALLVLDDTDWKCSACVWLFNKPHWQSRSLGSVWSVSWLLHFQCMQLEYAMVWYRKHNTHSTIILHLYFCRYFSDYAGNTDICCKWFYILSRTITCVSCKLQTAVVVCWQVCVTNQEVMAAECNCPQGCYKCHHVASILIWTAKNVTQTGFRKTSSMVNMAVIFAVIPAQHVEKGYEDVLNHTAINEKKLKGTMRQ